MHNSSIYPKEYLGASAYASSLLGGANVLGVVECEREISETLQQNMKTRLSTVMFCCRMCWKRYIFSRVMRFRGGVWVSNASSVFFFSVQIVPLEETFKDATKISVSLISHHLSAGIKQSRYQRQLNGFLMRN